MKITLYIVTNTNKEKPIIYTVATKRKDCVKFLTTLLMLQNKEHFIAWCELRNKQVNEKSWEEYTTTVSINKADNYIIKKVDYSPESIASMLRMFNRCSPIGGYERDIEFQVFLNSLPTEERDALINELNKLKEREKNNVGQDQKNTDIS